MELAGWISPGEYELALREPLVYNQEPYPILAPHFVMMVLQEIDQIITSKDVYEYGGLVVRTSLDLDWQIHAEESITRQLAELKRTQDGLGHNVNSASLAALDPKSGDILAMVGSPDYFDADISGAINMALSPRQPGSALKPLVYAVALDPEQPGGAWSAATMLLDVRTAFLTQDGETYIPANYDLREHGPVLVREALASSLNIPAVITLDHIGMESLVRTANKFGLSTLKDPDSYDLSLALGGGEVRLLELTAAYGAFANGGTRVQPRAILGINNLKGKQIYSSEITPQERVLDESVAWLISDILSDNDARQLGFGPNSILRLDRPAAVKTGTTSNFHDNWTVGYTPGLVVGVWTGNSDYQPMRNVNGLSGAAPIWHQFVRTVLADQPAVDFARPTNLVELEVCALSGLLPSETCPYRRMEWFIDGTQPDQVESFYRKVTLDSASGQLADENTPPDRWVQKVALDLPPQAHPWARSQGLTLYSDLINGLNVETISSNNLTPASISSISLNMISPPAGGIYHLTSGFDRDSQRVLIEAVGEVGLIEVTIWVDGEFIKEFSKAPYQTWWQLSPGGHQAWAEALCADGTQIMSDIVNFAVQED